MLQAVLRRHLIEDFIIAKKVVLQLEKSKLEILGYISLVGRLSQPCVDVRGADCISDFQAQKPHLTNCHSVSQTTISRDEEIADLMPHSTCCLNLERYFVTYSASFIGLIHAIMMLFGYAVGRIRSTIITDSHASSQSLS